MKIGTKTYKRLSATMAAMLVMGAITPQMLLHARADVGHVVISEIYGAGGNSGAAYKNDFIELYNPTDADVDLTGWSVQYASATSKAGAAFTGIFQLANSIPAHGHYLVLAGSYAAVGADITDYDASNTQVNMAASGGKIALVKNTTPITNKDDHSVVVDYVGFGTANDSEGTGSAFTFTSDNKKTIQRKSDATGVVSGQGNGYDTDNNANDFVYSTTPTPLSTKSPVEPPLGGGGEPQQQATAKPSASRFLFDNTTTSQAHLIGGASTVPAGAMVKVYSVDPAQGSATPLISREAELDGSFDLEFDSTGATTLYITATEDAKLESPAVEVHAGQPSAALSASGLTYSVSSTGQGIVSGAPGIAAANATVYVYDGDPAQGGHRLVERNSNGGKDSITAGSNGAFTFTFDSASSVSQVFVSQQSTDTYGINLEGPTTAVAQSVASVTPISTLRQNDDATGRPAASNLGHEIIIEGTLTIDNQIVDGTKNSFFIQDATGGMYIYDAPVAIIPTDGLHTGDKVRVTGTLKDSAKGATEITATSIEKTGTTEPAAMPQPVVKSVSELADYTKAEPLEGSLVQFTGKVTTVPVSASGGGYNVIVTDSSGKTLTYRVMTGTGINVATTLEKDKSYVFTGVLSQYDSSEPFKDGYQIFPRTAADIKPVTTLTLSHAPVTSAYLGNDLAFQADVAATGGTPAVALYYRAAGSSDAYTKVDMTADPAKLSSYGVTVPVQTLGATGFEYYIEATMGDLTRTSGTALQPNSCAVSQDTEGPTFTSEYPKTGSQVEGQSPTISVVIQDPSGLDTDALDVELDNHVLTRDLWTYTAQNSTLILNLSDPLALGLHGVKVTAHDKNHNMRDFAWAFELTAAFSGGTHYRGTTHNHTDVSHDGHGSSEDALKAAKVHGYDWFAFSDHSHDIDAGYADQVDPNNVGLPERTGGDNWKLQHDLAKQYTNNSFFVFPAFEMTSTTWGHSNVFGTDNFIDRKQAGGMYQNLDSYYKWVLQHPEAVAQFNHPDMSENAFNGFSPYDKNVDQLFTMLEVGNGSGHYGYVNAEEKFYHALDLGWHVSPTFGEDNHDGTWGQTTKRTVIVAKSLDEQSLMDSMRNMHVYMEEDPNFQLDMSANGQYMGSIVNSQSLSFDIHGKDDVAENASLPGYEYLATFKDYKSDDRIKKVELFTNGTTLVDSIAPMTTDFSWQPKVTVTGGQQWYVVKVTQMDGDEIYSAPIWTKVMPSDVKVSGVTVVGDAIVGDTPVDLEAGLTNLGTIDASNLNVKFYYDQEDEQHLIGNAQVASLKASGVTSATVRWNKPVSGSHTLIAVIENPPQGDNTADNRSTKTVMIKQPLNLKVLIDAAHGNENSSGDTGTYANNLTKFTRLLQTEGYTVEENKLPLTADVLASVKVLVITHASKALTADEKQAVSDFVKNGGSLFLADKSNFSNNPTLNNDMLQQMGSTIQINSDGLYDMSKSGNFWGTPATSPYSVRLHPGLVPNMLTDRVLGIDFYSGASLFKVGNLPLVNSDTVTLLGVGNETSYQSSLKSGFPAYDTVSDDHGGSAIPAIASEQVGDGRVIVSGMNILNDKQFDESFEPKGNNEFALNAFNWLAHREPTVLTIAQARTLPEGTPIVVEGTVTSAAGTFFDAFNLQDETGGIMAFNEVPDGSLHLGDKVRVYGKVKKFENNIELEFGQFTMDVIKVASDGVQVKPKTVKTGEAVSYKGQLIQVAGEVKSKYDDNSYVINDGSGDVLVFTDGYIAGQTGAVPDLKTGDWLQAVGLMGDFSDGARIRVRDTKELSQIPAPIIVNPDPGNGGNDNGNTHPPVPTKPTDDSIVKVVKPDHNGSVIKATADKQKLNDWIDKLFTDNKDTKKVTLNVEGDSNQVQMELSGSSFSKLADKNASAVMEVQSSLGKLSVPAGTLNQQLQALGLASDQTQLVMTLTRADEQTAQKLANTLKTSGATPLVTPVDFKIEAVSQDGKRTELNGFGAYIGHQLQLPDSTANIPSEQLAGVLVDPVHNTYYPVPTTFTTEGGKRVGLLQRQGNSYYTIVRNTVAFQDVPADHYAKSSIETLASKFIITGDGNGTYRPNGDVTRAEFATLLVRALGLLPQSSASHTFSDIHADDWYAPAVETAYAHHLLNGYEDGTFHPNQQISREEMVRMIVSAMQAAGYTAKLTDAEQAQQLAKFQDADHVQAWAREATAIAIKEGILHGVSDTQFAADQAADRGQTAAILFRMMKTLGFLNN